MLVIIADPAEASAPGRELGGMSERQITVCVDLYELGLVSFTPGWRKTWWFRLTSLGRQVCNAEKLRDG